MGRWTGRLLYKIDLWLIRENGEQTITKFLLEHGYFHAYLPRPPKIPEPDRVCCEAN